MKLFISILPLENVTKLSQNLFFILHGHTCAVSGGPLVDVETGEVVGINAAIRAHMEGTSFAIPINRVREIMNDLAEGRQISHGYLGLSLATCTPDWARQNNANVKDAKIHIPEIYGALVHNVFPRTPAEDGGLKPNDVVLDIGGKRVQSSDDARRLIDGAPVGEVRRSLILVCYDCVLLFCLTQIFCALSYAFCLKSA